MSEYELSSYVRFGGEGSLMYHSLFGNLSRIDRELYASIAGLQSPTCKGSLLNRFGENVFSQLYENYFLVEAREDERDVTKKWLQDRSALVPTGYYFEALQISASNLCNFACSYCFADTSDARSSIRTAITQNSPTLRFETACAGIDALLENAHLHQRSRIGVKFLGREPLVNWKTIERLLAHYDCASIAWSLTTNGSLITDEIAEVLRRHEVQLVVSLDGPQPTNDRLRILKDGSGSFTLVQAGLEALYRHNVRFSISSVISIATELSAYNSFMNNLLDYGVREFELTLAMQTREHRPHAHPVNEEQLLELLQSLYKFSVKRGVFLHGDWIDPFHRILSTVKRRTSREISRPLGVGCSASNHQISLESNGDLFPCRAMALHYGNVLDLQSVLASQNYGKVLMRTFYNVPYCQSCELEGHCQGTCLGSCEEESGNMYQPQSDYCRVYRKMTERLLSLIVEEKNEDII